MASTDVLETLSELRDLFRDASEAEIIRLARLDERPTRVAIAKAAKRDVEGIRIRERRAGLDPLRPDYTPRSVNAA